MAIGSMEILDAKASDMTHMDITNAMECNLGCELTVGFIVSGRKEWID